MQGVLDVATDLALSTFNLCAASYPGGETSRVMMLESSISPGKEAALTLKDILCQHPKYFVSNSAITALGGKSCDTRWQLDEALIRLKANYCIFDLFAYLPA